MTGAAAPQPGATGGEAGAPVVLHGRQGFQAAVRQAFDQLPQAQPREVVLVDAGFADWPLGERAVVACLEAWARSHRRLTVIAHGWDAFGTRHPRWVAWRRDWSHVVECRQVTDVEAAAVPTLLLAPGIGTLRLSDPVRFRGRWMPGDAAAERDARAAVDALLQRSQPGFPVTTLGL